MSNYRRPQGVLSAEEYRVFQTLVKRGAEVPKANPKSGKRFPHPMSLRLWFNRGALCLTVKVRSRLGGSFVWTGWDGGVHRALCIVH